MDYTDLLQELYRANYRRIERDDRLLDIFPTQNREKGIELWEQWSDQEVRLLRVRIPYDAKQLELYAIPRPKLESLLQRNVVAELEVYPLRASGAAVADQL